MKRFLIFLINVYQKTFSHYLGHQCRFIPTCSQYTKEAIEKYGALKGSIKGFRRILRCNPFCKGGVDPLI